MTIRRGPTGAWRCTSASAGVGLKVPVLARVVRLSIVRYCSVITTIAGVAAIEATVELIDPDGNTSGRFPCELAIPASVAAADLGGGGPRRTGGRRRLTDSLPGP